MLYANNSTETVQFDHVYTLRKVSGPHAGKGEWT
jgi:hypothetical protein